MRIDATKPAQAGRTTSAAVWAGRAASGLVVLFLLFDGAIKLVPIQPVVDAATQLGWPTDAATWRVLGGLLLAIALLYAVPRTSILGALVLTGYLGGAIATHARIGSPLFTHTLFGVYLGVLAWTGLWLRDPRLRMVLR